MHTRLQNPLGRFRQCHRCKLRLGGNRCAIQAGSSHHRVLPNKSSRSARRSVRLMASSTLRKSGRVRTQLKLEPGVGARECTVIKVRDGGKTHVILAVGLPPGACHVCRHTIIIKGRRLRCTPSLAFFSKFDAHLWDHRNGTRVSINGAREERWRA